jgi:chromosome segregation ATPase
MQQRIVMWGEIGTDNKALVTIQLLENDAKIIINAFPKDIVTKELQDKIFVEWKNGGEIEFPETTFQWTIDANQDNILPENVKVERPELITQIQHKWSRKIMSAKVMQLLTDETEHILQSIDSIQNYDQKLWDKAKQQWDKIADYQKKGEITWEQTTLLKEKINLVFDALKAVKRITSEHDVEQSRILSKNFEATIEQLQNKLIYPDEWKHIFEELKKIQEELKEAPIRWNSKKNLYDKINSIYDDLKKYRATENINKSKSRIKQLNQILSGIYESINREKDNYEMQVEKMQHYTRGRVQLDEIKNRFSYILDRIKEKENKAENIKKTIAEVEKLLTKEEYRKEKNQKENTANTNTSKEPKKEENSTTQEIIITTQDNTEDKIDKDIEIEQNSTN